MLPLCCDCLLGYRQTSPTIPINDFTSQHGGKTGSSSTARSDSRLPAGPVTDTGTSLDHFRFHTSSPDDPLPPAILNSSVADEPNLLPVCQAEVVESGELPVRPTETTQPHSGYDSRTELKKDDVIRTAAAGKSDAGVFEIQVIKESLGLGFCIEGGKGSAAGDRPISVKRLFLGILYFIGLFRNQ